MVQFRAPIHGPLKEYTTREVELIRPRHKRLRGAPPKPPSARFLRPRITRKPMAETPLHRRATIDAMSPPEDFNQERSDVYAGSDMFVYYVEGDLRRSVVPDVWVAFGAPKLPERRT